MSEVTYRLLRKTCRGTRFLIASCRAVVPNSHGIFARRFVSLIGHNSKEYWTFANLQRLLRICSAQIRRLRCKFAVSSQICSSPYKFAYCEFASDRCEFAACKFAEASANSRALRICNAFSQLLINFRHFDKFALRTAGSLYASFIHSLKASTLHGYKMDAVWLPSLLKKHQVQMPASR